MTGAPGEGDQPERRLMAAILRRAVFDFVFYRDPSHPRHELAIDAAGWLFWNGEEPEVEVGRWSFLHICRELGFAPKKVRDHCLALTPRELKRVTYVLKDKD